MKKVLIFLALIAFLPLHGQNPQLERLNKIIADNEHDTLVAKAYWDVTELLFLTHLDTVPVLCEKAEEICMRNLNSHHITLGERLAFMDILGKCQNNLGYVQAEYGNYEGAVDYYYNALAIQRQTKNLSDQGWSYNNIGYVYYTQEDWEPCFQNYNKALELFREAKDEGGVAHMMNNLGLAYKNNGDTLKALEYYRECLIHRELIDDQSGIALILHNIGHLEMDQGQFHEALAKFQRAARIHTEKGNESGYSSSIRSQAEVWFQLGELETAENLALESYNIAVSSKNPRHQMRTTKLLTDIYDAQQDFAALWKYHQLFDDISDSLEDQSFKKTVVEREMHFKFEKENALKDADHEQALQISKEREKRQQLYSIGIGTILVLIVVFLYFVYNRLKLSRRQNLIIESQKKLVEVKNKEITDSINYAKRIQQAIIPSDKLIRSLLPNSFVSYLPKDIVAGDFYWLKEVNDDIVFAVADCTGHGVPGAMVSVVCNNALNRVVREFGCREPADILMKTRELVIAEFEDNSSQVHDGMDISLCRFNPRTNKLVWAGANNPLWIVRKGEGKLEEIKANKQPIGFYEQLRPFDQHEVQLQIGDTIYIFSDGYADQFGGPKGKKYYSTRFKNFVVNLANDPIEDQRDILEAEFNIWRGDHDQIDDVCVLGLRI